MAGVAAAPARHAAEGCGLRDAGGAASALRSAARIAAGSARCARARRAWASRSTGKPRKHGKHRKHDDEHGAHIAATATAAGALRLKIGILKFGQRLLPVVSNSGSPKSAAASMVTVRAGKGCWCDAAAGGTGSRPPRLKGWQRSSLQTASADPRSGPCMAMAIDGVLRARGQKSASARAQRVHRGREPAADRTRGVRAGCAS